MLKASPSQIAAAKAQAAVLVGLDTGGFTPAVGVALAVRARWIAFAGLINALPHADPKGMARLVNITKRDPAQELRHVSQSASWWRSDWVQTVADAVRQVAPDPEAEPGSAGGLDGGHLKAFIERIEHVEEEKKALCDDIREIYAEAKGNGYDVKIMRKLIAIRRLDPNQRMEEEEILDLYISAVGS